MRSILFLLFVLLQFSSFAQKSADTKQLARLRFSKTIACDTLSEKAKSSCIGFFVAFYTAHLAQQDFQSCSFSPTCATYWAETAAQKGIIAAWIMGCDRLSRCKPQYHPENQANLK